MARIRSIHPGQATDEHFVEMSAEARLFCLLLRCEADDMGVFEWKPKGLKMKILPADDWDITVLLRELYDNGQVQEYDLDGKKYGAIRNFCKYQRPQKPKYVHPTTAEIRQYVGKEPKEYDTSTVPVQDEYDTVSVISPQMKEEGGRRDDEGGKSKGEFDLVFPEFWETYPHGLNKPSNFECMKEYGKALQTATHEEIMDGVQNYSQFLKHQKSTGFDQQPSKATVWLKNSRWRETYDLPKRTYEEPARGWERAVKTWRDEGTWSGLWGPPPNDPNTIVPLEHQEK